MTTITSKLQAVARLFDSIEGLKVYHYWRSDILKSTPFLVWTEKGERTEYEADDKKRLQYINLYFDYFTRDEFDPMIDIIQNVVNSSDVIKVWTLSDAGYDPETNLVNYSWEAVI